MSTAVSVSRVKQALLLELEQVGQQLKELVLALPDEWEELEQAEEQVRAGVLELGRGLLQAWSEAAPLRIVQPTCEHCAEPMRHKGYVSGPLVTTLGDIRIRRPPGLPPPRKRSPPKNAAPTNMPKTRSQPPLRQPIATTV